MADSFTFDGTDLSTYGLTVMEGNDQWMPDPSVQLAGAPGSGYRFGGSGYQAGEITLPCAVQAADLSTLRTYRDAIARVLDVTKGAKKLAIDSIASRYWLAILKSSIPAPNTHSGFGTVFDLTFALEGYGYDTSATSSSATISANPTSFTIASPSGSAPATCVWYLRNTTGSSYTGTLKINSTTFGEYIEWAGTLASNYWLRVGSVDSDGRYLYTLDTSTTGGSDPTVLSWSNAKTGITTNGGDWPRLKIATSNTITVSGISSATLQYSYTPRYIGA